MAYTSGNGNKPRAEQALQGFRLITLAGRLPVALVSAETEQHVLSTSEALKRAGFLPRLVRLRAGGSLAPIRLLLSARRLAAVVRHDRIRLVHARGLAAAAAACVVKCWLPGLHVLYEAVPATGASAFVARTLECLLERRVLRRADQVACESESMERNLEDRILGNKKVTVLPDAEEDLAVVLRSLYSPFLPP